MKISFEWVKGHQICGLGGAKWALLQEAEFKKKQIN
jgi:hypothetical protein